MRVIIDRFEGEYAVCEQENREMINIVTAKLPKEVKEGTVLIIEGDDIRIDINETENRQKRILNIMDKLWE